MGDEKYYIYDVFDGCVAVQQDFAGTTKVQQFLLA